MVCKLIKEDHIYYLTKNDKVIGSTYYKLPKGITYRLSIENCQSIERGYDLDELAISTYPFDGKADVINAISQQGYIKGFQKCLEILGDNKFSEEDIKQIIDKSRKFNSDRGEIDADAIQPFSDDFKDLEPIFSRNEIIQSLQKTEWEVEVEMSPSIEGWIPNLDKDEQLILKLKK